MTVKELKQHHKNIAEAGKAGNCLNAATHSYLSIEFAISILEDITSKRPNDIITNILNEIEELKQLLEKL